jgi:Kef-type K+ transport system membrane component KefB
VFAAFLAGFGLTADNDGTSPALDAVSKFSFAVFIPVYFAVVGYRLDLSKSLSLAMIAGFVTAACAVKMVCVGVGARLAGFCGRDAVNLAVATNARGGPGIVLASVAYDAQIINAPGFTTLIVLAVVTSQAAGAWLEHVLRSGKPLLEGESAAVTQASDQWPVVSEQ